MFSTQDICFHFKPIVIQICACWSSPCHECKRGRAKRAASVFKLEVKWFIRSVKEVWKRQKEAGARKTSKPPDRRAPEIMDGQLYLHTEDSQRALEKDKTQYKGINTVNKQIQINSLGINTGAYRWRVFRMFDWKKRSLAILSYRDLSGSL